MLALDIWPRLAYFAAENERPASNWISGPHGGIMKKLLALLALAGFTFVVPGYAVASMATAPASVASQGAKKKHTKKGAQKSSKAKHSTKKHKKSS
jgi:hypothetical protein